jgi:BirA family biotin operon repressor/biotin-[acetyl-CoA-carboxylase] ligase
METTVLRFDSLPSTNTEAARQAVRGAAEGLCVIAREQTAGRGRQQRVWVSPMDAGLYFSIILRPRLEASAWPLITLMTALAVRDALFEACELEADIKWPNDIYAAERKLCGILAETVETERGRACIVGIGLNLNDRAFPGELQNIATSIESLTRAAPDTQELLGTLLRALKRRYEMLQADGGQAAILRDWSTFSSYAEGLRVRVSLCDEMIEGFTRGLEPDGALRVETDAGEIKTVRAGDVTAVRKGEGD